MTDQRQENEAGIPMRWDDLYEEYATLRAMRADDVHQLRANLAALANEWDNRDQNHTDYEFGKATAYSHAADELRIVLSALSSSGSTAPRR